MCAIKYYISYVLFYLVYNIFEKRQSCIFFFPLLCQQILDEENFLHIPLFLILIFVFFLSFLGNTFLMSHVSYAEGRGDIVIYFNWSNIHCLDHLLCFSRLDQYSVLVLAEEAHATLQPKWCAIHYSGEITIRLEKEDVRKKGPRIDCKLC